MDGQQQRQQIQKFEDELAALAVAPVEDHEKILLRKYAILQQYAELLAEWAPLGFMRCDVLSNAARRLQEAVHTLALQFAPPLPAELEKSWYCIGRANEEDRGHFIYWRIVPCIPALVYYEEKLGKGKSCEALWDEFRSLLLDSMDIRLIATPTGRRVEGLKPQ